MIEEFYHKVRYYEKEAEDGHYHNPYDVSNELYDLIRKIPNVTGDERVKLEDIADDTGFLFWSM